MEKHTDEKLIAQLFGSQPDSVVWFVPVFDGANKKLIVDFTVRYCNDTACRILNADRSRIIGSTLLTSGLMDNVSVGRIFEQCVKVWDTEESIEFTYHSPGLDKYFNVQRSKVMNGVLSITRDRTAEVKTEKERERQAVLLNKIINNSPTCILLCQAKRNDAGRIADFDLLMVNDKIARDLNRSKEEIQSMSYGQLQPAVATNGLVDVLAEVIETGNRFNDEIFLEVFGGWFFLTADRVDDDKVILTYLNINDRKLASEKLEQQTKWYNNVLNQSPNGILAAEAVRDKANEIVDLTLRLANSSGRRMANLPEDCINKNFSSLFPELSAQGYFDKHKRVINTGEPYSTFLSFNREGQELWYQLSLSKLDDGVVSNFAEVTELKEKEKVIEEQKGLLSLMLNSSLNGLYTLEAVRNPAGEIVEFRITHVNEEFCKQSGKTADQLVGKLFGDVFPGSKGTGIFERNCRVLRTGESIRQELHYNADGVDRWYQNSVNRVTENQIVIAFHDVTPLKFAAMELERANEELKISNARLSDFTHIASHDLNEPLRKIITFVNMIEDQFGKELNPVAKDYFVRIHRTAERMQTLLNGLLTYSKFAHAENVFEEVNLQAIVAEVQGDLETVIQKKRATLLIHSLPVIQGDRTQLTQVFQNLISNALKFQKQTDIPFIEVRYEGKIRRGKLYHHISVKDNGIGFEQAEADKIFAVFHRLHARHEYEGSGVGLAIVQKAMENHGGYVTVKSEPGAGSCFNLFFPVSHE